jgi:hypothetical protein
MAAYTEPPARPTARIDSLRTVFAHCFAVFLRFFLDHRLTPGGGFPPGVVVSMP